MTQSAWTPGLAVLAAAVTLTLTGCGRDADDLPAEAWLDNPLRIRDATIRFFNAEDWDRGERSRLVLHGDTLTLDRDPAERYPHRGVWTSPAVESVFPFLELLPSWNVDTPPGTGAAFFVRTRGEEGEAWSPWLYVGSWGRTTSAGKRDVRFEHGRVKVDVLVLDRPAEAFQVRAVLQDFSLADDATPALRRLAAVWSSPPGAAREETANAAEPSPTLDSWARDLPLPFVPQGDSPEPLPSLVCSPASVTMVTRHFGAEASLLENAEAIFDAEYGLFGNWNRAVARAGELGFDAELARVRTWDEVKRRIAAGQPLVASIAFAEGEFPSSVMDSSRGHLLVIRGLTPEGDAIVNDPASREAGEAAIYRRAELARAWFGRGGVTYVITPREDAVAAAP